MDSLGLDSLSAAELLVKLQQGFDIEIPPMELMRSARGTIAELAQAVHLRLDLAHSAECAPDQLALEAEQAEHFEEAVVLPRQAGSSSGGPGATPADHRLPVAGDPRSDGGSWPSTP
ncbi:acyl carrier protein [Streptomyces sp. NPDC093591]|uniref:acyl carrier protein n=1 Tax=Streptomyces sp. NPDC093591 TaxID=3366044 RepID=UPI00380C3AD1